MRTHTTSYITSCMLYWWTCCWEASMSGNIAFLTLRKVSCYVWNRKPVPKSWSIAPLLKAIVMMTWLKSSFPNLVFRQVPISFICISACFIVPFFFSLLFSTIISLILLQGLFVEKSSQTFSNYYYFVYGLFCLNGSPSSVRKITYCIAGRYTYNF